MLAKTGSFIKLDRGLKNNSLWLMEKPFTKGQAWVDLLMLAQGVDKNREYRGKQQRVFRGNVYTSLYYLSDRWGWGRSKVYRFLERLMIAEMIVVQGWKIDDTTNRTVHRTTSDTKHDTTSDTTITIVNWDLYQYSETTNDTTNSPVRRTRSDTTDRTHKRKYTEKDTEKERKKEPTFVGTYPCGLAEKPEWMDDDEWDNVRYMTASNIPSLYRGDYDDIIEYLHDKKMGCLV